MNFFFGIKNSFLSCKLTIPKFQNFGKYSNNYLVYEAFPENNFWNINLVKCEQDESFFFLNNNTLDNKKIYFVANQEEIKKLKKQNNKLLDVSKFTNTSPAFRANLKIYIPNKGFSSYQSEYPFDMTMRTGSILSPISSLLNKEADQNFLFFKNIFFLPRNDESKLYLINISSKKVVNQFDIKENYLNQIEVDKKYISDDIYIFTESCLGIPLYVSIKNNHISFEHTHPPHHYILSQDRFKTIARIKNEIKNVINR
tara:strand:- start:733 stop:1500 length:768 start_codon:yes stop_codon:yes gene_type:complete